MSVQSSTYLPTAVPSAKQLAFQQWEFGIFLHFGLRTFYEGHRDWDGKPMAPFKFNPTHLDCNQWVTAAREAGAKYLVLTAKHHDGFANWPSQYTDFSVAASPWKGGHGDVVREFTDACRTGRMKIGLYYSPADAASPVYQDARAYDEYFINQISELLTGYGEIDMLWFDGCGSEGHVYDWQRIMPEIRRLQPNILIFNMGDPDYRWVGNEAGLAPKPLWNTELFDGSPRWLPAECDCMMRATNWFYSDQDEHTIKSLDELLGMYYYSVGRGCNLLLNIGPDRRGLLPNADVCRLREFGDEIYWRFGHPLATLSDCRRAEKGLEYLPTEPVLIDHVVLQEELSTGEHVRRFAIQVVPYLGGNAITVYEGYNIGHKAICRFPAVKARAVRLVVHESEGPVRLRAFNVYFCEREGIKALM